MQAEAWAALYVRGGWTYVDKGRDPENRRGDCWDFARAVQRERFGRLVPEVDEYETVADRAAVQAAIELHRVSDWCTALHEAEVRPGDLVFLRVANGWPVHVGVVAGEGCFVHLCGRGVRVEPLHLGFWRGKVAGYYRPCRPA